MPERTTQSPKSDLKPDAGSGIAGLRAAAGSMFRKFIDKTVQWIISDNWNGVRRRLLDKTAQRIISLGGIGVMLTLLLLFVFLLNEVVPLFRPASIEQVKQFTVNETKDSATVWLALEEQGEVAFRLGGDGVITFINVKTNEVISQTRLPIPATASTNGLAAAQPESGMLVLGFSNGEVLIFAHEYVTGFAGPDNQREITPSITYPLGENPLRIFAGERIKALALSSEDDGLLLAAINDANELKFLRASRPRSLIASIDPGAATPFTTELSPGLPINGEVSEAFIDGNQRRLLLPYSGGIRLVDIAAAFSDAPQQAISDIPLPDLAWQQSGLLVGGVSWLVAETSGQVHQFHLGSEAAPSSLTRVRSFPEGSYPEGIHPGRTQSLVAIIGEQRQKNFLAVDVSGRVVGYNTTTNREVFSAQVVAGTPRAVAISPRGDRLLVEQQAGQFSLWAIDNPHPEISWSALWNRIWYEGYPEPDYVWQSSASDNSFEPKFSLTPLAFGTLKAAAYAMLFAAPLAICSAIYTGYFMAPALRRKVKPLIELMEALPTVVLGFLAGFWLAPFIELNLLGVFAVLIILPLTILSLSFIWILLPGRIRLLVPEGWEVGLLLPVVLVSIWFAFFIATPVELAFFAGDLRAWLSNELGLDYAQRNAMVVGFAMGFAVIPTIFSIAEDAVFSVPRHLPYGSLALGATPWQSLYYVVLPTASPGIFSALIIGLGRAAGETMIVLMATGNTPIMDANIFEGMRTLAANIAIEVPESEVDSTHYRILFLAALVLFTFTFSVNTLAEVVRQRLQGRYTAL